MALERHSSPTKMLQLKKVTAMALKIKAQNLHK